MLAAKFNFSLQKPYHDEWIATLSDGVQEAIITASDIPSEPLLPLLWAVRLLLLGTNDARCSWWEEPGEYRWLFARQNEKISIRILWFKVIADWSDEQGETILQMECDLLPFAKRLSQQLDQISYQQKSPAVPPQDYQRFQKAITTFELVKPER